MVIASSKNTKMIFFFLQKQHPLKRKDLDSRFYTKSCSITVLVPYGYAPVSCAYTGDWTNEGHSWRNPISWKFYTTHPLGLTETDGSFFEDFYELTKINALIGKKGRENWIFRKGERWSPETNEISFPFIFPDLKLVWNPFYQRYDPPCNRNEHDCDVIPKIKCDTRESVHEIFEKDIDLFTTVYCPCCICKRCHNVHEWDCDNDSSRTMEL